MRKKMRNMLADWVQNLILHWNECVTFNIVINFFMFTPYINSIEALFIIPTDAHN